MPVAVAGDRYAPHLHDPVRAPAWTTARCKGITRIPFSKERKTSMPYQTVNPFTERLVKTFPEQTDEQLQSIIDQAQDTFSNDWSKRSPTDRKKVLKNVGKLVVKTSG